MIVTGRHLPRRTFLKTLGTAIALPYLDAMTPAFASGPGRTLRRAGPLGAAAARAAADLHLHPEWRDDGGLDAGGDRRGVRVHAHPQAARGVSRSHARAERAGAQERLRAGRWPGRPCARGGVLSHRRASEEDRRRRHQEQRLGGPDRGAAHRHGHAVSVARTGVRRLADRRQLRLRLQLRVHQQPLVAQRDGAQSAGNQSPPRLRAALRLL